MKKLIISLFAGILTVSGFSVYATAGPITAFQCEVAVCDVEITVVNNTTIVANPQILVVAHRNSNKDRRPAMIRYTLSTAGYSFTQGGIKFDNPGTQFARFPTVPGPPVIVVADINNDLPPLTAYKYKIMIVDEEGNALTLDPVIINGGPVPQ